MRRAAALAPGEGRRADSQRSRRYALQMDMESVGRLVTEHGLSG